MKLRQRIKFWNLTGNILNRDRKVRQICQAACRVRQGSRNGATSKVKSLQRHEPPYRFWQCPCLVIADDINLSNLSLLTANDSLPLALISRPPTIPRRIEPILSAYTFVEVP